jgi:uncharacterized peroxidase-related enzyme
MSFLRNLPEDAALLQLFQLYPETARPILAYHQILLRGPSPLSVAERELIAAYVSGLNSCGYCHGIHTRTAEAFGIAEGLLEALLADLDDAPVDPRMKPLLHYVRKLTRMPPRLTQADAEAVFAAGWDDRALHDAVSVCALFNFMNRLVEGTGLVASPEYTAASAGRLSAPAGYLGLEAYLPKP